MCMSKISIEYNPLLHYNEIGYHKTYSIYKESIIENGFKPSCDDDDWLGEGIYFWDNLDNANWWNKNKNKGTMKHCVFQCELRCKANKYLNLDDKNEMNKFDIFSKQYIKEMRKLGEKIPKFGNNNQRKKFFCDLYCKKNNFEILSHTFEHDIINSAGFKVGIEYKRQICVRENSNIKIIAVKE